jgi:hypothetical protein
VAAKAGGRKKLLVAVLALGLLTAGQPSIAAGQHQAEQVTVSREFHDAAWVAGGTAVTLTLRELGVKPERAALLGSVGLVALSKLSECARWCGRPDIDWPASIALKDAVYDMVLASSSVPLLIGRRKGWKAGVGAGLAWIGTFVVLRQVAWNSP